MNPFVMGRSLGESPGCRGMERQRVGLRNTSRPFDIFPWLVFLLMLALGACSTTKTVVRKITPASDSLKKRVMVLPFLDQAGLGKEKMKGIHSAFVSYLKKSPDLVVISSPRSSIETKHSRSPVYGIIIPPALVQKAGALGLNALVTGVVSPVDVTVRKSGIWPFRSPKRFYEVSLVINVVDVVTGTLYLTELESKKESLPISEEDQGLDKETSQEVFDKTLPVLLKREARALVKRLAREAWAGTVLSVKDGALTINAGRDVGARPGLEFDVFEKGELILSRSGSSFHPLGARVGEIRIRSVTEKEAVAVAVTGKGFQPGQVVIEKH